VLWAKPVEGFAAHETLFAQNNFTEILVCHFHPARKEFAMFDLNESDMLSKLHPYKIDRPDGWCYIFVHEVISSERAKNQFIAVPNLVVQQAEKEYFGVGANVQDALADCLNKIKSVGIQTLFPHLEQAYQGSE